VNRVNYNQPVLVVDPEPAQRSALCDLLTSQGQNVDTAPDGLSAAELINRKSYKLVLAEASLPMKSGLSLLADIQGQAERPPVVLISNQGQVKEAVEAIRLGALDYLVRPISSEIIQEIMAKLAAMNRLAARLRTGEKPPPAKDKRAIVTVSPELERLMEIARAVAPSKASVLISGESGTGKELFARHIHTHSDRSEGPFVAVNCAALPENLLESELFGHEKGAFTGAISRKPGKFELAEGGTILLDEISEMDLSLQAKLLRVLQENEIDRVGGREPVAVDIRVVATTNRDLPQEVGKGTFREDLFYRLNVIPLRLPALRERTEDIEPLARHFLAKYSAANRKNGLSLDPETVRVLQGHRWPGNVRELENIIERAVLLCRSGVIKTSDLLLEVKVSQAAPKPAVSFQPGRTIREMERTMIEAALGETNGNRTHAAKMLGISVRTLRNKLSEYRHEAGQAEDGLAAVGG